MAEGGDAMIKICVSLCTSVRVHKNSKMWANFDEISCWDKEDKSDLLGMISWRRPQGRPRNTVQEDANAQPLSTLWRSEIARDHGAAQRSIMMGMIHLIIQITG